MAWTTPRTWVTDELVTAAIMNTHVRDNLNSLYSFRKMKVSDEIVNNSAALQDDADFAFTVAASEKWGVELFVKLDTTTAADWKFNFTVPVGTTHEHSLIYNPTAAAVDWQSGDFTIAGTTSASSLLHVMAFFLIGGTGGTVQFQWAQGTATAVDTRVKAGSFMVAHRCD
jgi:hypothetical protein